MTTRDLPTPGPGVYQAIVRREFDAGFHRLRFRWNVRVDSWYLDVANDNNERQVYGIRLGTGNDKLRAHKARDVPQGSLNVVDSTGQGVQPTLENFGKTVLLQYVDAVVPETATVALAQPTVFPGPVPPGPTVPLHAEQHEIGGADLLTITSLQAGEFTAGMVLTTDGANTASWQLPVSIETIATTETDATKVLNPDGASGVQWVDPTALQNLPTITLFDNTVVAISGFTQIVFQDVKDTPDATYFSQPDASSIEIETAGRYLIMARCSIGLDSPSPGDVGRYQMKVYLNGSSVGAEGLGAEQSGIEDSRFKCDMHVSCAQRFAKTDVLTLRARAFNSDVDGNSVVDSASLTAVYMGP